MDAASRYQRFVLLARRNNPVVNRLGQFAIWMLRTASNHRNLSLALAAAFAALIVGGFLVSSMSVATVLWVLAASMAASLFSVTVIGFAGHLMQREANETAPRLAALDRQLREQERTNREDTSRLRTELVARIDASESRLVSDVHDLIVRMLELKPELATHRNQISTIENNVMLELKPELAKHRDQIATIVNNLAKAALLRAEASVYNRGLFQRFNRTLNEPQIQTFLSDWAKPLVLELNKARLGYLANRSCSLEGQMKGRLATSIETVVLRCLVGLAPKRTEVSILEIGTLFGVGAAAVYEAAANECDNVHLTVIDPLDGYYASGNRDILTGARVNETTLRHNWARAPIPEEDYTIIKHLSTDSAAIEEARQRQYDVLIIDGDHSFDGVKFDFEHYAPMMRPGGYILFDDYDVEEWPDIKRYVDTEVVELETLYRIGAAFRTAVFQVR